MPAQGFDFDVEHTMNATTLTWIWTSLIATLGALAGCGGGGGGDGDGGDGGNPGGNPPPGTTPTTVTVSLGDDRVVDEGSGGGMTTIEFDVTLDTAATSTVTVDYTLGHVTTEDSDFLPGSGTVTFAVGETAATIAVETAADDAFELNEDFTVRLSNPSSNAAIGDAEATARLVNDDPLTVIFDLWNLGYGDGTLTGLTLELDYELLLDLQDLLDDLGVPELLLPYDIYYASDVHIPFPVASGHLRIDVGSGTSGRLQVVLPPGFDIPGLGVDGRFLVVFDWSQILAGLPVSTWEFEVAIEPQDVTTLARLNVADAVVFNEGDAGTSTDATFIAYLSDPLAADLVLNWATADQTATSPDDYAAASGAVTIPAGALEASFTVTVNGDDQAEGLVPEQFAVVLDAASDTVILGFPWATGFIYDDDTAVETRRIVIRNADLVEGDSGSADMVFDVTLDAPATAPVTFRYATRNDTAEAGSDYAATSGEATFRPGDGELTVAVPVFGDTLPEDDETFMLEVTGILGDAVAGGSGVGRIRTDDPIARLSIDNVAVTEGDSGTTTLTFTVALAEPLREALDVAYTSNDVTATAGEDYTAVSSTLTIPAGAVAGRIEVTVSGDTVLEDDEVFEMNISTTLETAIVTDNTGAGTILNDDSAGGWAGAELVHAPVGFGISGGEAFRPQVALGPGGERHVIFLEDSAVWHTVSPGRTVWSAPAEIAPVASMGRSARLVVDDAGRAVLAIPNGFFEGYSYDPATGWQREATPQAVESEATPELAGDPATGEAVAVWLQPGTAATGFIRSVWSARYVPGSGWLDMLPVETTDDDALLPALAMAPGGETVAVFPQNLTPGFIADIAAFRWNGSGWSGPTVLDSVVTEQADRPRIDMNASGDAAVVWHQVEPVPSGGLARRSIYVNRYDAGLGTWSGAELVERELDYTAEEPEVAIDAAGNVFVVWIQQSPDYSTRNLMASRYDAAGDAWSGPRPLELDDTVGGFPINSQQVVADDLGNAIVVWIQDDGAQRNLQSARYSANDGDWTPNELLENMNTGDANLPHLVIDRETGSAMVVWHQADGEDTDIWANRYTN